MLAFVVFRTQYRRNEEKIICSYQNMYEATIEGYAFPHAIHYYKPITRAVPNSGFYYSAE